MTSGRGTCRKENMIMWTLKKECEDCKYCIDGKCTHPHSMYCEHCELWTPKDEAEQALKGREGK